jgi:uncharacterized protein (TIGR03086 family)
MTEATVEQLADAADRIGRLISGIRPDQWNDPTPCSEWDVQALVAHVIDGNATVTAALGGEPPVRHDPRTGFDGSAAAMLAAFRLPGALQRLVDVPFGRVPGAVALDLRLTEFLVHGWDIAHATGRPTDFPEDVAEQELRFTAGALGRVPPGRRPFAPPVPVGEAAPALDRLAAALGRAPGLSAH